MKREFRNELGRAIRIEIEDVGGVGAKDQNRVAVIGPDSTFECYLTPIETRELGYTIVRFLIGDYMDEPPPRMTEEDADTITEWCTGGSSIPPSQRRCDDCLIGGDGTAYCTMNCSGVPDDRKVRS